MTQEEKTNRIKLIVKIVVVIAVTVIATLILNAVAFRHTEGLVYRTRTGDCYHSPGCGYLWGSAIPMGYDQAVSSSLRICSRCGSEPSGTIVVNNYLLAAVIVIAIEGAIALLILWYKAKQEEPTTVESNAASKISNASDSQKAVPLTPPKYDRKQDPFYIELKSHPQEKLNMMIGVIVIHKKFGEGVVIAISKDYLSVDFPGYETKQFVFPDAFFDKHLEIKKQ